MYIIPFHPDHLLDLNLSDEEGFFKNDILNGSLRRSFLVPTASFSALDDNKIYACCGVIPIWDGRGLFWVLFDRNIGPKRFLKSILFGRDFISNMLNSGFYRLEAYVQQNYDKAHTLATLLKFEYEGLAMKLDGKRNYALYARTK